MNKRLIVSIALGVLVAAGLLAVMGADLFWYHHTSNIVSGDDHTQYLLLAGRSGGQVVVGGDTADTLRVSGIAGANYSEFEADGTLLFTGDAIVWEDLRAPATVINPPGVEADPDWDATNIGWLFDAGGIEILYIIFQVPHSYKEGSDLYPHVHWQPTSTNGGNVLWRIDYKWTNMDATDAGSTTPVELLAPGDGTVLKHQLDSFAVLDGTGKTISSILTIKLSRMGNDEDDTYTGDALLKEFDIHYQVDTVGSRAELVK